MIDVNKKGEVWVFAEQHNGHLEDTPIELMSKARRLADTLGVKVAAVLLGSSVKGLSTKLIQYGADKVYLAEHLLLGMIKEHESIVMKTLDESSEEEKGDYGVIKEKIRADLKRYISKNTQRRPLIMPVILEV